MRQCAIAMTVDSELRPSFIYEHDTLQCVRERRIAFGQHIGFRNPWRKMFQRIEKYLRRGFELRAQRIS